MFSFIHTDIRSGNGGLQKKTIPATLQETDMVKYFIILKIIHFV